MGFPPDSRVMNQILAATSVVTMTLVARERPNTEPFQRSKIYLRRPGELIRANVMMGGRTYIRKRAVDAFRFRENDGLSEATD